MSSRADHVFLIPLTKHLTHLPLTSLAAKSLKTVSLLVLLSLLISALVSTGCVSPKRTPNLARIFAAARAKTGKRPIIVIPGMLGSELINSKTGVVEWPSVLRTSRTDAILPISPDLNANRDDLVPGKIVETLRLGRILPEVYVYRDLLEALRHFGGYREGDWANPPVDGDKDTFYVFAYDWRRDNVENARELTRRVERLKDTLRRPDLRFNVIAHSMGGLVARYAAMYGNNDLPAGDAPIQPNWSGAAHIKKIVMLGVPNEGSADAFATLLYGYSITEGLRRRVPLLNKLTAEDSVTSPALFQLLPHHTAARFLDEELKPLDIDLYDPETWKRYGWSAVNDPDYRARFAAGKDGLAPPTAVNDRLRNLDEYFATVLKRARRFHEALDAASEIDPPVMLFAVGGDCEETLQSPVIIRDKVKDRWITLIRPQEIKLANGQKIRKQVVTEAMYAPGDGRVTRRSLLGEDLAGRRRTGSVFDSPLALTYAVFACDLHGQLPRNATLQDNALTALVSEAMR